MRFRNFRKRDRHYRLRLRVGRRVQVILRSSRSKVRSTVVMLAVATLAIAGMVAAIARTAIDEGGVVAAGAVEDDGAGCAVTLPGSSSAIARLPDPFTRLNGTRISARSDWQCRREEIKQLAERSIYGAKPVRPASVTGTVSATSITVDVSQNGRTASFSAGVQLPSGTGPFPAVVVVGGLGADTATIRGAGAAIISYDPMAVGREGTPRNNKQGAFYTIYGATSST